MARMMITRQAALDILDGEELVLDQIVGHSRWAVQHRVIFKMIDKLWQMNYQVGATELQDESPWEYDREVLCREVREIQKVDYEIIKDDV